MPMPTPEQMAQMQAMMGGAGAGSFGGFGGPPAPPADARPAHERYADQLAQLQGMGCVQVYSACTRASRAREFAR